LNAHWSIFKSETLKHVGEGLVRIVLDVRLVVFSRRRRRHLFREEEYLADALLAVQSLADGV
jgi:hypothetical protein